MHLRLRRFCTIGCSSLALFFLDLFDVEREAQNRSDAGQCSQLRARLVHAREDEDFGAVRSGVLDELENILNHTVDIGAKTTDEDSVFRGFTSLSAKFDG